MLLSELWSDWYTYANMTVTVLCHTFPFVSRTVTSPSRLYAKGGTRCPARWQTCTLGLRIPTPPSSTLLVHVFCRVCLSKVALSDAFAWRL